MSWHNPLTERQIARARATGKLDGLAGAGKPLPDRPGDAFISPGDALGFRIMAEAGVLPAEITLKKAAQSQREHIATLTDPAERRAALSVLADIELRQAIAQEARARFLR